MTFEASDTIACAYCGGEIRAAARLCKHCMRQTQSMPFGGPVPAVASTTRVAGALRSFVAARGMVPVTAVDAVLGSHPGADAMQLLAGLTMSGHLTPGQVDNVRELFRQQQRAEATRLLQAVAQRGLLSGAQCYEAIANFDAAVLSQVPEEFLVTSRMLTREQALLITGTLPGLQHTTAPSVANAEAGLTAPGVVPPEILARFNWGAFLLSHLWPFWNGAVGLGIGCWAATLVSWMTGGITGIVTLGLSIYLGFEGNRLAVKGRRFQSREEFESVQRAWTRAGVISYLVMAGLFVVILGYVLIGLST